MELMWTSDGAGIIIASSEEVAHQAAVVDALNDSKTWGEFRKLLPASELEDRPDFEEMFEEHDDDEPFNRDEVYGVGDGDYPVSLVYDTENYLPEEFVDEFMIETRLHGEYLQIPPSELPGVIDALQAEGHTLTESESDFF